MQTNPVAPDGPSFGDVPIEGHVLAQAFLLARIVNLVEESEGAVGAAKAIVDQLRLADMAQAAARIGPLRDSFCACAGHDRETAHGAMQALVYQAMTSPLGGLDSGAGPFEVAGLLAGQLLRDLSEAGSCWPVLHCAWQEALARESKRSSGKCASDDIRTTEEN